MAAEGGGTDPVRLNRDVRAVWNENAPFWDEYTGEGKQFQRLLIGPTTEQLLHLQPGELVLEVACGNGAFARRMAALGAHVLATDFSEVFIERARARTTEHADRIEYRVVDAIDQEELLALGIGRFDAAVCNQALMDMVTIDPLASALSQLLKPDGRFVFSISHPCFNTVGIKKLIEEEDRDGEIVDTYSIKVMTYLGLGPGKGMGIIGQPVPHYYFDRTLHDLFAPFFRAGFAIDGLEEPGFGEEAEASRPFSWSNFKEIPPVLMVRMRQMRGLE
jgi:SAM-dependent methyltransferase